MDKGIRAAARFISRIGLGLMILLGLLTPTLLRGRAASQQPFTPTAPVRIPELIRPKVTLIAPPLTITKSAPTFVMVNLGILDLRSVQLAGETTRTTAAISFEDKFSASVNVQSPSTMLLGESRVITLEIIPKVLAQAAMVRAEMNALKIDILDDGYPEKTVIADTPVRWNWDIAPKEAGEQEFFLSLSYINDQGSRVHWQNVPLQMNVSIAASPTGAATGTDIDTPTLISYEITALPTDTAVPFQTLTPTNTPNATLVFTATPTDTFLKKVSDDVANNFGSYLATLVTLVLGLLTVYFQFIRKGGKGSK